MRLYKSKARVRVFHSSLSGGYKQFKAPNMPGDLWTVFEFDNSSGVTRIRTVGSESSSSNVDSHGSSVTDGIELMGGAIQGTELSLSTAVTTLAGSSSGSTDATGTSASFYFPYGITTDGTNLYVADSSNHRIRKIVIDNGTVTTLAGSSSGSTDATGTSASFNTPQGITTDGTNVYVGDYGNHRVRKIVISTGVVTTLAGSSSGSTDATGTSARFYDPRGITTDGTNLYVADYGNHRIRKIVISTGVVTTLAGSSSGSTDATGTSASFNGPIGITTDGTNLYVTDFNNHRIRKIVIDNGTVTTLAGSSSGSTDNATGTSAKFYYPWGITTDGTNLYVADRLNYRIRKIVIDNGTVTTLAGSSEGYTDNATGTSARFKNQVGITTDGTNLYVGDNGNHRIRKIE
jgi:sugar lactone lactonase YvrE